MPAKAEKFFETCSRQFASKIASNTGNKIKFDDTMIKIVGNPFGQGLDGLKGRSYEIHAKWNAGDDWSKCIDVHDLVSTFDYRIVCGDSFKFDTGSSIVPNDGRVSLIAKNGARVDGAYASGKMITCEVSTASSLSEYDSAYGQPAKRYPFSLSWISKVSLNNISKTFFLKVNYKGWTDLVHLKPEF